MLPDRVSNPGPLTYESGALPIAADLGERVLIVYCCCCCIVVLRCCFVVLRPR